MESPVDVVSLPQRAKPVVIGLYGVSAAGKSYHLQCLRNQLPLKSYAFFEGSEVLGQIVPGGLAAFKTLPDDEKKKRREEAIAWIGSKDDKEALNVWTNCDREIYTHIVYLDIATSLVAQQRASDSVRTRSVLSEDHIRRWKAGEKLQLRQLCYENGILLAVVHNGDQLLQLVRDFSQHSEALNETRALARMDELLGSFIRERETVLLFDADKTLAPEDSGQLYWSHRESEAGDPLTELFSSKLAYSYTAFRQAMLLSQISMYADILSLMQKAAEASHITMLVVTCGQRGIWEQVLANVGLESRVVLIGCRRLSDGFVVTPSVKATLVKHLRQDFGQWVVAFGDSPLDIPMLVAANEAVVVVGEKDKRSRSMDNALRSAIADGLQARQLLLPAGVPPRLNTTVLPLVELPSKTLLEPPRAWLTVLHATDRPTAKLLATPMRDARIQGPILQAAHTRAGWYLAVELLASVLGTEPVEIPHVQGSATVGYRVKSEEQTAIVALMRGGEPLARGVFEACPAARFLHVREPTDLAVQQLHGIQTVVLVDSVVNNGKTVANFARRVHTLNPNARLVVVAGVVQARAVAKTSLIEHTLREVEAPLTLVALRISENKYSGRGGTDTGNRLFNTTHMD
ncbi:uracil phosphoribosyltransferase-domain-containing protein [Auriculariales sp. MPI-PUGE-AT-0066]|nr:uracil phosphoribosyltransferase-domain-containing protein [Auriculariales sp. MPI-PUGE-AT-0066]